MIFFFRQKTAYELLSSLVGSEMFIRDSVIAKNFYPVADIIQFVPVWCGGEIQFSQSYLPMHMLVHLIQNCLLEPFSDSVKRNALHDRIKEAFHYKPFSVRIRDTAAQ